MEVMRKNSNGIITRDCGLGYDVIIRMGFFALLLRLTSGVFFSEFMFTFAGNGTMTVILKALKLIQNGLVFSAVPFCFIRRPRRCVLFTAAVLSVVTVNCLLFPENNPLVWHEARSLIVSLYIPAVICMSVDMDRNLWKIVKLYGYSGFALSAAVTVLFVLGKNSLADKSSYDMSYSYALITPALILMATFFREGKFLNMLVSLVLVAAIIKYGARGPFICYCVGAALMLITYLVRKTGRRDIKTEVTAKHNFAVALCIVLTVAALVVGAFAVLRENNVKTGIRFIDAFNGKGADSGRAQYHYEPALSHIAEESIFAGDGLYSDRTYLYNNIMRVAPGRAAGKPDYLYGSYSHNIIIELMFHFGLIGGALLFAGLVWLIVQAFRKGGENTWVVCIFTGLSSALMVSESYLSSAGLWILVGFCISIICKGGIKKWKKQASVSAE